MSMDKTLVRVANPEEQKADTYRYWQSVSSGERMRATWELSLRFYRLKGLANHGQRLQRTLVRTQRP